MSQLLMMASLETDNASAVLEGRLGPQYAFQPIMHAVTYASALKSATQPRAPRQLNATAPEFIPHSARPLQDLQPLMTSRLAPFI